MNTSPSPVAAFCSYGTQYQGFLTNHQRIEQDVDALLQEFGAGRDVRRDVYAALHTPGRSPLSSGFRYENGEGANRTVVYATNPISFLDDNKPTAHEAVARREKSREDEKTKQDRATNAEKAVPKSARSPGAWPLAVASGTLCR